MPNYKKTLKQAETDYIRKTAERQAILKIIHQRTLEIEYDSGIALGAAAGYDFGSARIEGEFVYQKNDFDKLINPDGDVSEASSGDLSSIALLINGYYDFHNNTKFIPFVTAGLGFAKVELNNIVHVKRAKVTDAPYNDDDTVFAYQVGAGVGYAVTEKITIESKYRYFATSDFEITDGTEKLEHNRHNLLFGIRVGF